MQNNKQFQKIFPDKFISRSITTQKELDDAFLKYPNYSRTYIQTALYSGDIREWYENYWPKVYEYLDKDFLKKFVTEKEHNSRAWEFHLAAVLIERGLQLEKKTWKIGPDFCIKTKSGKKIWIEAITCDLGTIDPVEPYPDMQPGKIYSFGGNIEDIHRPRALRITNAIGVKLEKFKNYLVNSKSGVSSKDCLLIAVNGSLIQHFADPGMLFKRSIFGQGPDVLIKVLGQEKLQGGFYKPTPIIIKKKDSYEEKIPANFMEMNEFAKISAVLYCGHNIAFDQLNGINPGDDFLFAYHVNPINPIPKDFFVFGRGIKKDVKTGSISDQNQK